MDEKDLELLKSGAIDLTHCDFRGADLSGLDLSGRDFSCSLMQQANLVEANFSNCVFSRTKLNSIKATNAIFKNARFEYVNLAVCNFTNADFENAYLFSANLNRSNFTNANLSHCSIDNSNIGEGNVFKDVHYDFATSFEGSSILRSTARDDCFSYYYFDSGKLKRKPVDEHYNNESGGLVTHTARNDNELPSGVDVVCEGQAYKTNVSVAKKSTISIEIVGLKKLLSEEEERLGSKPNEADSLIEWEEKIKFLNSMRSGLVRLEDELISFTHDEDAGRVNEQFEILAKDFEAWLSENRPEMVDWVARLSFSTFFIGVMSMLGATMPVATPVVLGMVCGQKAVEIIKSTTSTPYS